MNHTDNMSSLEMTQRLGESAGPTWQTGTLRLRGVTSYATVMTQDVV